MPAQRREIWRLLVWRQERWQIRAVEYPTEGAALSALQTFRDWDQTANVPVGRPLFARVMVEHVEQFVTENVLSRREV